MGSNANAGGGKGYITTVGANWVQMESNFVRDLSIVNTIVVLVCPDDFVVSMLVCVEKPDEPNGRLIKRMTRRVEERADESLTRMRVIFSRKQGKHSQKVSKSVVLASAPPITVLGVPPQADTEAESRSATSESEYVVLDTNLSVGEFWKRARVLNFGDVKMRVYYNVPTIARITPPSNPYVGLPLTCSDVSMFYTTDNHLYYEWRVGKVDDKAPNSLNETVVVSTERVFIPNEEHLGQRLIFRVTPDKEVGLWSQIELAPVQVLPPPAVRWEQTTSFAEAPTFRVTTYNILFDDFCNSKASKLRIYPFATNEVLAIENRQVRITQELLAYHTDIICLQECGRKLFERFLLPTMEVCGFKGVYVNKGGDVQEGCALLVRKARFSVVSTDSFSLNWATLEMDFPELASRISAHKELKESLSRVTTVAAVHVLRDEHTGQEMVVGNTHLFYHANACHIRTIQAYMLLCRLHKASSVKGADTTRRPIVLCGDCNFTHTTGGYRLLTTGQVEEEHPSWEKGKLFRWGCARGLGHSEEELYQLQLAGQVLPQLGSPVSSATKVKESKTPVCEEELPPLEEYFHESLHAPLHLVDAYNRTDPTMPWTNFTMTFREVIDYIFFSEDAVEVLRTIPIPAESELIEHVALPNRKYPSDHLALVADLVLKTK